MRIIKCKRVLFTALLLLIAYLGSYAINASFGGYWLKPVSGGKVVYASGLSASTAILWQPYYGYSSPYKITALGRLYYPLIEIDRKYWHHTRDMLENDGKLLENPDRLKIHPKYRADHPYNK